MLLATFRDDEAGPAHPLRGLGDLNAEHVSRLKLPPLSREAVTQLAASDARDGSRVFAITGGNPFFVRELISAPMGSIPATVRDAMLARLARCSIAARGCGVGCAHAGPHGFTPVDAPSKIRFARRARGSATRVSLRSSNARSKSCGVLAEGRTNAQLARKLFVATKTVDHHVSAILGKLQARSRAHAVTVAHELGLMKRS